MDLLILANQDGVVDMTHEAIARRTNRPIETIRSTIAELESPDPRSRTKTANGARLQRIDEHRDWGWLIINYDYFKGLATDAQYREKTRVRVAKWREQNRNVTHSNVTVTLPYECESESESSSESLEEKEGVGERGVVTHRRPAKVEEVIAKGQFIGVSEQDCRDWFRDCEACGWTRGDGTPFDNWSRQLVIHRDKLAERRAKSGTVNGQPIARVQDIRTAIQFKEERARELKERYSTEGPVSTDWSDTIKKSEYFQIRREIKALKQKAEKMVML